MPSKENQTIHNHAPLINVAGVSVESVKASQRAILDIIRSNNAEAVKLAALNALNGLCHVSASVSNCHFEGAKS